MADAAYWESHVLYAVRQLWRTATALEDERGWRHDAILDAWGTYARALLEFLGTNPRPGAPQARDLAPPAAGHRDRIGGYKPDALHRRLCGLVAHLGADRDALKADRQEVGLVTHDLLSALFIVRAAAEDGGVHLAWPPDLDPLPERRSYLDSTDAPGVTTKRVR